MRVATNMLTDRVLLNLQHNLQRLMNLETQLSSGRRINTPSDDPVGTHRDLQYRAELSKNEQYRKNIDRGMDWILAYDDILSELKTLVSSAKEIAVALANDTYDHVARKAAATEVESLFHRLIQLANTQHGSDFVFSGFRTNDPTLVATPHGVVYGGDQGRINFQIDSFSRITINLTGDNVFLTQVSNLGEDADLNPGLAATTLLADLHTGRGVDLSPGTFTVTDQNLGIVSTIDVSAAVDIDDVLTSINAQLNADGITNLVARIGLEGNNILFDTTPNGLITTATSLGVLNDGNGIQGTEIFISDGAGINATVDFSSAATVGDVINAFNSQVAAQGINNVTLQINAAGTGLDVVDSNAIPLGLTITESGEPGDTAAGLGIVGDVSPVLNGGDLSPLVSFRIEETTGTTAADLGILGEFSGDFAGEDLDPILRASTAVADLNAGGGICLGRVVVKQGDVSCTIDLSSPPVLTVQDVLDAFNNSGLDITASINQSGRGIQIINNDPYRSLTIEDEGNGRTAKDLGVFGSSDMMGSLLVLMNALNADDAEGIGLLLGNLDDAMDHLLSQRATTGAKAQRLESTRSHLLDLELVILDQLSEVEDADISRLVTDLATFENSYQASLFASAGIIQPSLLEFLK